MKKLWNYINLEDLMEIIFKLKIKKKIKFYEKYKET